jgi:hypothetical protein
MPDLAIPPAALTSFRQRLCTGGHSDGAFSIHTRLPEAAEANDSLIGIQYEHWFYSPDSWETAEAIPLQGKYTTDEQTVSNHEATFAGRAGLCAET